MRKNLLYIYFISIISTSILLLASNSAPVSSTGAPGEMTCAKSDCHSDNAINSGDGILMIDVDNGISQYIPGKTYKITVSMNQMSINRFGFQFLALRDSDSSNTGKVIISEPSRTQEMQGFGNLVNRNYVTYKFAGTEAFSNGLGKWTFDWTAPNENVGDITFYIASVAANNDGTDHGDFTYTKSLKLTPKLLDVESLTNKNKIEIYPNIVNDRLQINYTLENNSNINFEIINSSGSKIDEISYSNLGIGNNSSNINLNSNLQDGLYFLKSTLENETIFTKFIIKK